MFGEYRFLQRVSVAVLASLAICTSAWAQSAENKFYEGYFLEESTGDFAGAAALYDQVVADRGANANLKAKAQARLVRCKEELKCADFASLMPGSTIAYVELNEPGKKVQTLLKSLGLLRDGENAVDEGAKRFAVSAELIEAALGIRGAAVAITGIDLSTQEPMGVAVFHPGDVAVIRGLIESALPAGGKPVAPIGGFQTYHVENEVFVTLTSRLVVASPQRALVEGVVSRLSGQLADSLADNREMADVLKDRGSSLLFFCLNAKPIMPMINGMLAGAAQKNPEIAMARALLDPQSLRSLSGQFGVDADGIFLDLNLRLAKGHQNLVFNFLRMPAINRETLKSIPEGAAGFVVASLNEASSRFSANAAGDEAPIVTAMDIGRELFGNITGVALFALPPEGEKAAGGPPIPDAAAVLTVNDPSKTRALWTQILGIASLASGAGVVQGTTEQIEGVTAYRYSLPENITLYFATNGNDALIATSRSALSRSIAAKRSGRSVLTDAAFADRLSKMGPATVKAVLVHPGRCALIAKQFMSPDEVAEMEPFVAMMTDTMFGLFVEHSEGSLRFSAHLSGLPDIGPLIAAKFEQEEARHRAEAKLAGAIKGKKWDEAVAMIDGRLAERGPSADLTWKKFRVLAVGKKDRGAALACATELYEQIGDNANQLNTYAWYLVTRKKYGGQYNDLAVKFSQRSNDLTKNKNWMYVDTLARATFESGKTAEAIELQNKAIELSGGDGWKDMKKSLARFEKATSETKLAASAG
ncbi:MAG: hypothetical protein IH987_15100 [Planctomycetes bacterium]|nr:hypothetical protein [Planctomycetota bacterium]